jgi:hypothetical protein
MPAERKYPLAGGTRDLKKGGNVLHATAAVQSTWIQQHAQFTVRRM